MICTSRAFTLSSPAALWNPHLLLAKPDHMAVRHDSCSGCAGATFVKKGIRAGVLPSILAALMSARSATRASLKNLDADDVEMRAVLDSRQKALKLVANALYGFTGRRNLQRDGPGEAA